MNLLGDQFDRQKQYFASGITRSYPWRIEQLDRVARLARESEAALQEAVR
jgi:aldehyde dehydrogenase (NAD+)